MDRKTIQDAYLDTAVEQLVRGESPPDVVDSVLGHSTGRSSGRLAEAPRRTELWPRLAAAAVVLAGIGIVWVVAVSQRGDEDPSPVAPTHEQGDEQDPVKPAPERELVQPKSAEEFREWIAQATGAVVQVHRAYPLGVPEPVLPVRVPGEPAIEWMRLSWNRDVAAKLGACIQGDMGGPAIGRPDSDGKFRIGGKRVRVEPTDYVRLELPGHRAVECAFQIDIRAGGGFSSGTRDGFVSIPGVGSYPCPDLQDVWMPEILKAGRITLWRRGVLHQKEMTPDRIAMMDLESARLHDFEKAQLTYLAGQKRLKRLDIRYSPRLHTQDALLHLDPLVELEELFVLPLSLGSDEFEQQAWLRAMRALPEVCSLDALHVLQPGLTPWSTNRLVFGLSNPGVYPPPDPVEAARRLTSLRAFSVSRVWGADGRFSALEKLPRLESLSLYQCHHLTGSLFAKLEAKSTLTTLYLNGCLGLTDSGIEEIARLPALRELYLNYSRAKLTPAALRALAGVSSLRRLELNGWLSRGDPLGLGKEVVSQLQKGTQQEWGSALRELVSSGHVEWLSIADWKYLTRDDLEPLTHAKNLKFLVLAGTVGDGEGEIPIDDVADWLMDAIDGVTLVTN